MNSKIKKYVRFVSGVISLPIIFLIAQPMWVFLDWITANEGDLHDTIMGVLRDEDSISNTCLTLLWEWATLQ